MLHQVRPPTAHRLPTYCFTSPLAWYRLACSARSQCRPVVISALIPTSPPPPPPPPPRRPTVHRKEVHGRLPAHHWGGVWHPDHRVRRPEDQAPDLGHRRPGAVPSRDPVVRAPSSLGLGLGLARAAAAVTVGGGRGEGEGGGLTRRDGEVTSPCASLRPTVALTLVPSVFAASDGAHPVPSLS